jgi:hypothetical protein
VREAAVDDLTSIPNGPMPIEIGHCLEYAVYHGLIARWRSSGRTHRRAMDEEKRRKHRENV